MYEVTLIKGGSLSGPLFHREYVSGRVYKYGAKDSKYVEQVLKNEPRLKVKALSQPKPVKISKSDKVTKTDTKKSSEPSKKNEGSSK